MKLIGALLALSSPLALACPFTTTPGTYTEVAVPCTGLSPDFSQVVAVNQPTVNGGECRVELPAGQAFQVEGDKLVVTQGARFVRTVGTLTDKPSCYQTDSGSDYYATWNRVRL
ncbi:MAG: hypothetical protein ACXVB9_13965 [Bdellovibrionota bacterium]